VAVLRRLLTVIGDNVEGSSDGREDEETIVHPVADRGRGRSRRSSASWPESSRRRSCPGFAASFRWLQQATRARASLDVYVHDLGSLRDMLPESIRGDSIPCGQVLDPQPPSGRADIDPALLTVRAANLFEDWDRLLESLVELPVDDRPGGPASDRRAGRQAASARSTSASCAMGRAIDASSPALEYHELRKKGKELRYLLELFGSGCSARRRWGR